VSSASNNPVHIDAGPYYIRTLGEKDASERWGEWPADPDVAFLLNAPTRRMTRSDIADYIRSFDQSSRFLLGIFDKRGDTHIGFYTISVNRPAGRGLINVLIGERAYRNRGVLKATRIPFARFFFETLKLQTMLAAALARNQIVVKRLLKDEWVLDRTLKRHVAPPGGGEMLDICLLRYSRETWLKNRDNPPP
jgi:RimJ/RimL family protein N-acetyltransferase